MNKYFILPALFFTLFIVAQEETKKPSINDFDFESVSNPALLLLDETPSYINTPYNFRSLALYLSSGFSNSNVALELSPYWVVGNNDTSYRDYRGIRVKGDGLSINPFKALYRNLTFSAGYLAKQFDGFPDEKRTVSLGARTTFIEVYGKKRTAQVVDVLSAIESDMEDEALNAFIEFFVRLDIMKVDENICAHKDEKKQEYLAAAKSTQILLNKDHALQLYRPRKKFSHKGTYGHAVIAGGSYGKMGSVVMSTKACLKTGAGLVTAYIPQMGMNIMQTSVQEAMVEADRQNGRFLEEIDFEGSPDVAGIGMGMGTEQATVEAFGKFLSGYDKPLVVDADGLNIISKNKKFLQALPQKTIITPHPKEFERLIGEWEDDFDKLKKAKEFANEHKLVLVLKGAHTFIIHEDYFYINDTGNPGMATAGAGDVLTGMLTGLLSQGYDPLSAAIFGVYLHGRAGDIAASHLGYESVVAGDIIDNISEAYKDLFTQPQDENASQNP